jgi:heme/copper-type cytochrome/quinol oxidase subunit 2
MVVRAVVSILMLVVVLFFVFGWIFPLFIGRRLKQENNPLAKGPARLAALWGVMVIIFISCVVGMGYFAFHEIRSYSPGVSGTEFAAASYKGGLAKIKLSNVAEAKLSADCGKNGNLKFSTSNGVFEVPAGKVNITAYEATARDKDNHKWTEQIHYYSWRGQTNSLNLDEGATRDLAIGTSLKAAVQVTWSAISDNISMRPMVNDEAGNEVSLISEDRARDVPSFQAFDIDGKEVWNGKFQYG